ncbi:MAG: hypothetical protein JWQ89_2272 [Devosia sp.]|nr:hypothetical protein [Devosia sp.]
MVLSLLTVPDVFHFLFESVNRIPRNPHPSMGVAQCAICLGRLGLCRIERGGRCIRPPRPKVGEDASCRTEPGKARGMSGLPDFAPLSVASALGLTCQSYRCVSNQRIANVSQPADRRARGIPLPWTAVSRFVHLIVPSVASALAWPDPRQTGWAMCSSRALVLPFLPAALAYAVPGAGLGGSALGRAPAGGTGSAEPVGRQDALGGSGPAYRHPGLQRLVKISVSHSAPIGSG